MNRTRIFSAVGTAALVIVTATALVSAPAYAAHARRQQQSMRTAAAGTSQTVVLAVQLTSRGTTLTTLPGGVTYGWNDLAASTLWGQQRAEMRFQGSVNYVSGSGPFGGFATITRADGAVMGLVVNGSAMSLGKGTSDTRFSGNVSVIGGSGALTGVQGVGTMTGLRAGQLGAPVELVFRITYTGGSAA